MAETEVLKRLVLKALNGMGGSGSIIDICKHVWNNHSEDLRLLGDGFYSWQYDIRWAAYELRKEGLLKPVADSPKGIWEIAE